MAPAIYIRLRPLGINAAHANSGLMQIHSPLDGIVVLNTVWKQGTMGEVQESDQSNGRVVRERNE